MVVSPSVLRRGIVVVAATALVAITGCGGGKSDAQQVTDVVRAFMVATAAGNGRAACAQMTAEGQRKVVDMRGTGSAMSCAEFLSARPSASGMREARNATVRATVHGERAHATAQPWPDTAILFELRKVGGDWKIDFTLASVVTASDG
jgi:hypothetical protein